VFRHAAKDMSSDGSVITVTSYEMEYTFSISNRETIYFITYTVSDLGATQNCAVETGTRAAGA
jgi:hypothetical protein